MVDWKIAAVQMDCRLGEVERNLASVRAKLAEAAANGAKIVVFPECILSGYGFECLDEAMPFTETLPGPSTEILVQDCRRLNVFCVIGLLENEASTERVFNASALLGPAGFLGSYRKVHLPVLGVDRFTTPGDRAFAVHDLGGLRLGMNICYDAGFPEASRMLTLLGADLIVLPTNWPSGAMCIPTHVVPTRAIENHIFYAAVNRVGTERGTVFIGRSQILDCAGNPLAASDDDRETVLYAAIDPAKARNKQIVFSPGKYEINRVGHRRPEMYKRLAES